MTTDALLNISLGNYGVVKKVYVPKPKEYTPAVKCVSATCQWCKAPFIAREADIKRGWGMFCSKSCKATKQTFGSKDNFEKYKKKYPLTKRR